MTRSLFPPADFSPLGLAVGAAGGPGVRPDAPRPSPQAAAEPVAEPSDQADLGEAWVRLVAGRRRTARWPCRRRSSATCRPTTTSPDKSPATTSSTSTWSAPSTSATTAITTQLNRRFRKYDAVLYELVAPEGTVVPRGRGTSNSHPLGALQNAHEVDARGRAPARADRLHAAELRPRRPVARRVLRSRWTTATRASSQMYFRIIGASLAQQSQQAADGESPEVDMHGGAVRQGPRRGGSRSPWPSSSRAWSR